MNDDDPLLTTQQLEITPPHRRSAQPFTLGPIDLTVAGGDTVTIIGPSSSGKTVLLGALAGYHRPTRGSITRALSRHHPIVGVVPQAVSLVDGLTVGENILLDTRLGLAEPPDPDWLDRIVGDLNLHMLWSRHTHEASYGEAHRIMLARSLAAQPAIRLVDEPFAHQDPEMCTTIAAILHDATTRTRCCIIATRREQPDLLETATQRLSLTAVG